MVIVGASVHEPIGSIVVGIAQRVIRRFGGTLDCTVVATCDSKKRNCSCDCKETFHVFPPEIGGHRIPKKSGSLGGIE